MSGPVIVFTIGLLILAIVLMVDTHRAARFEYDAEYRHSIKVKRHEAWHTDRQYAENVTPLANCSDSECPGWR